MTGQTLQLITRLRSGGEVKGAPTDVSTFDEERIREALEGLARIILNIKNLTYLSLDLLDEGTILIHPDDISYIQLRGSTKELNALIQEYV
jgi:hypothetical protein